MTFCWVEPGEQNRGLLSNGSAQLGNLDNVRFRVNAFSHRNSFHRAFTFVIHVSQTGNLPSLTAMLAISRSLGIGAPLCFPLICAIASCLPISIDPGYVSVMWLACSCINTRKPTYHHLGLSKPTSLCFGMLYFCLMPLSNITNKSGMAMCISLEAGTKPNFGLIWRNKDTIESITSAMGTCVPFKVTRFWKSVSSILSFLKGA